AAGDARLPEAGPVGDRGAVICSSAIAGTPEVQAAYERPSDCGRRPGAGLPAEASFYDSGFANLTPPRLARRFGLRGPCTTVSTGCTAGIDALGLGFDLIRNDEVDVAVIVAAEAPLCGISYATLDIIGSLATDGSEPEHASRPFDARRS